MDVDRLHSPSRRDFLKGVALIGSVAFLDAACSTQNQAAAPQSEALHTTPPTESHTTVPTPEVTASPSETIPVPEMDPSKPWVYDFGKLPDGPIPERDWNYITGTDIPDIHGEAEIYTSRPENVRVQNGLLVIEGRKENYGGRAFTSARIDTKGKFAFTYGHIEVLMEVPDGVGSWPAAWMMPDQPMYNPDDFGVGANDPYRWAMNGEIDFAEMIGSIPGQNIPAAHSIGRLRAGVDYTPGTISKPYTQFHRYGLIKTPDKLTFTIDGKPFAHRTPNSNSPMDWPFNQPYYLILDLALGGTWAGSEKQKYPPYGIDTKHSPWLMRIKQIYYKPIKA